MSAAVEQLGTYSASCAKPECPPCSHTLQKSNMDPSSSLSLSQWTQRATQCPRSNDTSKTSTRAFLVSQVTTIPSRQPAKHIAYTSQHHQTHSRRTTTSWITPSSSTSWTPMASSSMPSERLARLTMLSGGYRRRSRCGRSGRGKPCRLLARAASGTAVATM